MAATFENLENSEQLREAERRVAFAKTMHDEFVAANNTPENLLMTGMGMMSPGGGIISQIASEARKNILKNWKMQVQSLTKGQSNPDIIRRRYRELHQIPDEYAPPDVPLILDPKLESIGTTRSWVKGSHDTVSRNEILLSPIRESPEGNTLLHEKTHVRTGRGVGSDLVEQIKARTVHNINREYHRKGYKETYGINPNENVAREMGMLGIENLQEFTPGKRKIPVEKLNQEYSKSLDNAFKFSAFTDPSTTVKGLLSTIREIKANPQLSAKTIEKAEKEIFDEVKRYVK